MATYSKDLGIKLITTGDEAGTWGTSANSNFELFETAIVGHVTVTLAMAGSSGSPNNFQIVDFTASNARNRLVEFVDAADLGATAFVQINPNDAEGYWFVRNSLSGNRSILIFQGTYDAGRDFEVPAGADVVVRSTGTGATSYIYNVFNNLQVDSISPSSGLTLDGSLAMGGIIDMNGNKITDLGVPTVGTDAATKAYADAAGSIVYASGDQILWRPTIAPYTVPAGWSIVAQNNKALRIVSTAGALSSGGATAFSTVFGSSTTTGAHALTLAQIPSHSHTIRGGATSWVGTSTSSVSGSAAVQFPTVPASFTGTDAAGSGSTHTHTLSLDLQYYDMNIIQKT
jgi:hypothetical protein